MNINHLDLKRLRTPLEMALSKYQQKTGFEFGEFEDFTLTPEKPNSARTIIPILERSVKIGDFYAIIFVKGDGTGDSNTYKLDDILIPLQYQHTEKPERVIPRAKTGIVCEGCFPLFSMSPDGYTSMFAMSLDELGLVKNTIAPLWKLGQNKSDYSYTIRNHKNCDPQIYVTVGTNNNTIRIGDPHSIYYDESTEDAVQVTGFVGIKDLKNPIYNISKKWMRPAR